MWVKVAQQITDPLVHFLPIENKQIDKHPWLNTNRHNATNWTNYLTEGQPAGMDSDKKWTHEKIDEQSIKQTAEQKHKK